MSVVMLSSLSSLLVEEVNVASARGSPVKVHPRLSYSDRPPRAGIFHHTRNFSVSDQVMPEENFAGLQRRDDRSLEVLCG
jgi:hypothetical protein